MPKKIIALLLVCLFLITTASAQDLRLQIISAAYDDLSRIFSNKKGEMSDPDLTLVEQMDAMLGGPPDEIIELSRSVYFYSACRAQSCAEKAAIIIDMNQKKMLGGAWRHFHCQNKPAPQIKCNEAATVTIYYFKELQKKGSLRPEIKNRLESWSRKVGRKYEETIEGD